MSPSNLTWQDRGLLATEWPRSEAVCPKNRQSQGLPV